MPEDASSRTDGETKTVKLPTTMTSPAVSAGSEGEVTVPLPSFAVEAEKTVPIISPAEPAIPLVKVQPPQSSSIERSHDEAGQVTDVIPVLFEEKKIPLTVKWRRPPRVFIVAGVSILILIVTGIAVTSLYVNHEEPTNASAGDCLHGNGIDPGSRKARTVSLKKVSCDSPTAKYKVVGRVDRKPESTVNADSKLCDSFPGTQFIYWEGIPRKRGTVLCLVSTQEKK